MTSTLDKEKVCLLSIVNMYLNYALVCWFNVKIKQVDFDSRSCTQNMVIGEKNREKISLLCTKEFKNSGRKLWSNIMDNGINGKPLH